MRFQAPGIQPAVLVMMVAMQPCIVNTQHQEVEKSNLTQLQVKH